MGVARVVGTSLVLMVAPSAGVGCGSGVPVIPTGPHRHEHVLPIPVPEAPPPAQVETIPPRPDESCLWADGSWTWSEGRWTWSDGRWVRPPAECHYAIATTLWVASRDGDTLYFTPGAWYRAEGSEPCPAPRPCGPSR